MPQYLRFQPLTADDRSHKARYKGGVGKVYDFTLGVLPVTKGGGRIWTAIAALPAEPDPITYNCTLRGSDSTGALRSLAQLRPRTEWC